MTQTCGCHRRTKPKNKLDLHLEYLFVGKITTSEPGGGYSCAQTVNLGAGPDFGLGHFYHWSKILCASVFLHGDKDTGPWIKSVIKEPRYNYYFTPEQCAEAGSAALSFLKECVHLEKGRRNCTGGFSHI